MKKYAIAVSAVAMVVLGAFWLLLANDTITPEGHADKGANANGASLPHSNSRLSTAPSTAKPAPIIATTANLSLPMKSAIYKEYEKAPSLFAFALKYGLDSAPPEGKFLAAKIMLDDCKKLAFGYKLYRENMLLRSRPDSSTKEQQLAGIAAVEAKCGGDWAAFPPSKERADDLIQSASQGGSTAASAYIVANALDTIPVAELAGRVNQALATNDLPTIEQAMRAVITVGQQMGAIPLADGATANPFLFTHAWMLALCDVGQDCGPGSATMAGTCAAAFCDVNTYEEYIQRHSSTPADYLVITGLKQQIVAGLVGTGNKENLGIGVFRKIKGR